MLTTIVIYIIKAYQVLLSSWLPPSCRYTPSCSQYSIIAFNRYGIIKGFILSFRRILRCHPWGGSGHDLVP